MKRILLDENIPIGLCRLLTAHNVRHVHHQDWTGIANGRLITAAEEAGFEVMITADRSIRFQQNLQSRHLALVVLSSNNWPLIQRNVDAIAAALGRTVPGTLQEIDLEAFTN